MRRSSQVKSNASCSKNNSRKQYKQDKHQSAPNLPVQELEGVLQYAHINVTQQYRPAQLQELLYNAKLEGRYGVVGPSVGLTLADLYVCQHSRRINKASRQVVVKLRAEIAWLDPVSA
jgi:hypothetical protein